MRRVAVLLAALIGACAETGLMGGASHGISAPANFKQFTDQLRSMPKANLGITWDNSSGTADNFLHSYFGNTYDGRLADVVYFVDHANRNDNPDIYLSVMKGGKPRGVLYDEQFAWAIVAVAAPADTCFHATILHELVVQETSPAELGLLSAIIALAKVGVSSAAPAKSTSTVYDIDLPGCDPDKASEKTVGLREAPAKKKGSEQKASAPSIVVTGEGNQVEAAVATSPEAKASTPDASKPDPTAPSESKPHFYLAASSGGQNLYVANVKLSLLSSTTSRVVLSYHFASPSASDTDVPLNASVTVRDVKKPVFRVSLAFGARLEVEGVHTSSGPTHFGVYDPDMYVLFHWVLPALTYGQQWFPSVFSGTNTLSRTALTDWVVGFRFPFGDTQAGLVLGGDLTRYNYNVIPACTAMCQTRSAEHWGLFFGVDYSF